MHAIDPTLRIRSTQLAVADLERSASFYEHVLGLALLRRDDDRALLGGDPQAAALELVRLEQPQAVPPRSTGLFHVAWLHPSRAGLAETVRRIAAAGWPFTGASDHGVSEALYLDDPDGLGIEVYTDRPRERWARPRDGQGVVMVSEPLDVEALLACSPGEPGPEAEAGTAIGHVHLKVADVPRALAFYEALGFERQALIPSAAFVAAGGYHHHLGLNSWQSAGGEPAPADAPGLRAIEFELAGAGAVATVGESAAAAAAAAAGSAAGDGAGAGAETVPEDQEGALTVLGPDGERLVFSAR